MAGKVSIQHSKANGLRSLKGIVNVYNYDVT